MYAKILFFIEFTVIPQLSFAINYFNLFNYYHYIILYYILDNNIIYEIVGYVVNISNFSRWIIIINIEILMNITI